MAQAMQKTVSCVLIALIALISAHLWLQDGAIQEQKRLKANLEDIEYKNEIARRRNEVLQHEVTALRNGDADAIEGAARHELGMMHSNEIFVSFAGEKKDAKDLP